MPQSVAAIALKMSIPGILARFGYRGVLVANTVAMGTLMALFATIVPGTPWWLIVLEAALFGFSSSAPIHEHEHARLRRRRGR